MISGQSGVDSAISGHTKAKDGKNPKRNGKYEGHFGRGARPASGGHQDHSTHWAGNFSEIFLVHRVVTQKWPQEEGRANMTRIKNEVFEETRRMEADVSSYVSASQANSNKELLTDNYIKLQLGQLLSNNTKMYFSGADSVLGSVLQKIFPTN